MKNIVVCCDGTGNEYGTNNTNVVTTYDLATESTAQRRYYDPGVGTLRALAGATGRGLCKNVEDAYRFLMQVYENGDRLFLFGFSRGAFTVRSLAGMLYCCGLLRPTATNLVEHASKLYHKKDRGDKAEVARGFRATFARPCPVHFIGVWDTVESLLLNAGRKWHDARLSPETKFAYHAIAIDERRRDFPPCLWDPTSRKKGQVLEQVWFAGVHCDVGGWYEDRGLSNLALQWMLRKASKCHMILDKKALARHQGDPLAKLHESYTRRWRIRGSWPRAIPNRAHIHNSVQARMLGSSYAPALPPKYKLVQ